MVESYFDISANLQQVKNSISHTRNDINFKHCSVGLVSQKFALSLQAYKFLITLLDAKSLQRKLSLNPQMPSWVDSTLCGVKSDCNFVICKDFCLRFSDFV